MKNKQKWTMKDGTKIRICDMSDSHLINAVRMLERNAPRAEAKIMSEAYAAASCIHGEIAEICIDNELRYAEENGIEMEEIFPIYEHLIKELNHRKLG